LADGHQPDPADSDELDGVYAALRPLLVSISYEMVGAIGEAEDIVQEAFLRFHRELADAEARAVLVIALDVAGGQVVALRGITNPDKLRHLDRRSGQARES
jgi:Sigma-70 region 2